MTVDNDVRGPREGRTTPRQHGNDTGTGTGTGSATAAGSEAAAPTPWARVIGIGFGLAILIGVLVTAFAWPAAESAPRDIPIAIAGPESAVADVEQQLDAAVPGGFDARAVPDLGSARRLIVDREVYGAIVLTEPGAPRVLTASAASPVVAQLIEGIATRQGQPTVGATPAPVTEVAVTDVVALGEGDPRGSAFAAAALPMVIGGVIVAVAMSFLVSGIGRRVGGAVVAAVAAGWVVILVTQAWLGALDGSAWANASVVGLTIAAISMTMIGLFALIGPPGIGLGAVVMFLIGNSLSGAASAPELLPSGWGAFGQLLPPGAGATLLRSTSYFDGAAAGTPLLVLATWLAVGVALAAIGRRVRPASRAALVG